MKKIKLSGKTKTWLRAAGIRALKTMGQTAAALLSASATIQQVDGATAVGTVALAGILSLCTSVAGLPEVNTYLEEQED